MCKTMKELEQAVTDYRSMSVLLEEITAEFESLKREIIGYLDDNNKLSTCERRTLDTKRLEEDLGSVSEYQRVSQYRRLYVK